MRNPRKAVMRFPAWQTWGEAANRVLDEVARAEPEFDEVARSLGVEMTPEEAEASQQRLQRLGTKAANALGSGLECWQWDDKGPTGWRWRLIRDITIAAQDPDVDVAQWFRGYTPLGINRPIVARGVFPWADTTKAQEASAEYLAALNGYHKVDRNYSSFHENLRESSAELERLKQDGHLEPLGGWEDIVARWPEAKATKLATLVKTRPDGSHKVRFIADMRRSGVNGLTYAEEKIVLPRGTDLTRDALDLMEYNGADVELFTADFTDAFLNLPIAPEEKQHAIIMESTDQYCAYRGVPFGLATAPLVWGRAAAWLARAAQALHPPDQHRLQIYVDDPAGVVRGTSKERDRIISKTLILWASLGARIALHKASRGTCIKWIGAKYSVLHKGIQVAVDAERITKLTEVVETALSQKGLVAGMRSLAGELSWVAGIVPTIRPFVNMVWGAVHGMHEQAIKVRTGQSSARARPLGLVHAKTVRLPLQWMKKFLQGHHGGLQRNRWVADRYTHPQWVLRTDASTTGLGGILLDQRGNPVRWWAGCIPPETLSELRIPAGEPGLMTVYELLALLMSVHIWANLFRRCRLGLLVQLDSESALRVAIKLASPHPVVNRVAAELALCLHRAALEDHQH